MVGVGACITTQAGFATEALSVSTNSAIDAARARLDTLASLGAEAGLLFGSFFSEDTIKDPAYLLATIRESALANISGLSPHTTRRSRSGFDFRFPDSLIAIANRNNLALCGGYLATHDNVPSWITAQTSPTDALAELKLIVETTMTHYADAFTYWIVSNEAIFINSGNVNDFRSCGWLSAMGGDLDAGTDYVSQAFSAARITAPKARLVYGDFGIEDSDSRSLRKRAAVLNVLTALKRRSLVDTLGIQAHLNVFSDFDPVLFGKFLDDVQSLGIDIVITEMDVNDHAAPTDVTLRDELVAKKYSQFLSSLFKYANPKSIVCWGLSDKHSWLNRPRADGLLQRGDLLDTEFRRKSAYFAVRQALIDHSKASFH
jgi:endo-1,4-beta-xylanase